MLPLDNDNNEADCLLHNLKNGIELVLSSRSIGKESLVIRSIGNILSHGLREPKHSFWHIVRDLTHPSTRAILARSLRHTTDSFQRGIVWIYYMVVEGSLESYLRCMIKDQELLSRFYVESSLLRNFYSSSRFIALVLAFSEIDLNPTESRVKPFLSVKSLEGELGSPTDSGFPDSDTNSSFSERASILKSEMDFEDSPLSGTGDRVVVRRRRKESSGKRVSFHEDVESPPLVRKVRESSGEYEGIFESWLKGKGEVGSEAESIDTVGERGAPEGQEDPQWTAEHKRSSAEDLRSKVLRKCLPVNKVALMKRFLSSMPDRPLPTKRRSMYLGPHPVDDDLVKQLNHQISLELSTQAPFRSSESSINRELRLSLEALLQTTIYKVHHVTHHDGKPLILAVTNSSVSLLDTTWIPRTVEFAKLKAVLISSGGRVLTLVTHENREVVVGLPDDSNEVCCSLALASKRASEIELDFIEVESVWPHQFVCFGEELVGGALEECLEEEGELMVRGAEGSGRWSPATVTLIGGASLQVSTRAHSHLYELSNCVRCCRKPTDRPHTFSLLFKNKKELLMAGPDEHTVCNWMHSIFNSIASRVEKRENSEGLMKLCFPIVKDRVLTVRDMMNNDIMSLKVDEVSTLLTGDKYIVIETDCREVNDRNCGDWALYFGTRESQKEFLSSLLSVRPILEQMTFGHEMVCPGWDWCEKRQKELWSRYESLTHRLITG